MLINNEKDVIKAVEVAKEKTNNVKQNAQKVTLLPS